MPLTHDARERVRGLRASGGTTDFQRGSQFFATTPKCQMPCKAATDGGQSLFRYQEQHA